MADFNPDLGFEAVERLDAELRDAIARRKAGLKELSTITGVDVGTLKRYLNRSAVLSPQILTLMLLALRDTAAPRSGSLATWRMAHETAAGRTRLYMVRDDERVLVGASVDYEAEASDIAEELADPLIVSAASTIATGLERLFLALGPPPEDSAVEDEPYGVSPVGGRQ